jgi:hypothetical protein
LISLLRNPGGEPRGDKIVTPVRLIPSPVQGVDLILSGTPEFEALVQAHYSRVADEVHNLEPYLVFIANRTNRAIVAYAPWFRMERTAPFGDSAWAPQFKYPALRRNS